VSRSEASWRRGSRRGFTVLEVIVALAVSGLVLLGGRLMLESIGAAAEQTRQAARAADRLANADRLLRSLVGRLEVGTNYSGRFGGTDQSVHFTTWCDTPGGWLERCDATIGFVRTGDSTALVASLVAREPHGDIGPRTVVLAKGARTGGIRYLNDPRAGGQWFVGWGDAITAPLAIGIIMGGDTSILRVGERE